MNLPVYSRRWDHPESYNIERTPDGWNISHLTIGGPCSPDGSPFLFENLEHDFINHPADLSGYMRYLWEHSAGMDEDELQRHLNILGEWVQNVERGSPGDLWVGYN